MQYDKAAVKTTLYEYRYAIALSVLTLVAFCFRFYDWNLNSHWSDELWSAHVSNPNNTFEQLLAYLRVDPHPYFYQILLWKVYAFFGYSEFTGRFLSIVVGTLNVPAVYYMAKIIVNRRVAVYAALFATLSPFLIVCSMEVRSYSLFLLLSIVATCCFYLLATMNRRRDAVCYLVAAFLLINIHFYGYLVVFGHFLCVFFPAFRQHRTFLYFVILYGLLFVIDLPFLYRIFFMAKGTKQFWITIPDLSFFVETFIIYCKSAMMAGIMSVLMLAGLVTVKNNRLLILAGTSFISVCCIPFVVSQFLPYGVLFYRYVIPVTPFIFILAAAGVAAIPGAKVRYGVAGCLIVLMLYALAKSDVYTVFKEDYRGVMLQIAQKRTDERVFGMYFSNPIRIWYGLDFEIEEFDKHATIPSGKRFWVFMPIGISKPVPEQLNAKVVEELSLASMWGVLYEKL